MPMIDSAEDWPLLKIHAYLAGGLRAGRSVADLVSDFTDHPKFEAAARLGIGMAIADGAPKKEKPKEIRFTPNAARYARWSRSAEVVGIPLTAWIQLAADGVLRPTPDENPTASVQETTQEKKAGKLERPPNGWLRERIVAEMGDKPLRASDVPALARKLGESSHSVFSSLGSMSARGRVHHDKLRNTYQIVKGE